MKRSDNATPHLAEHYDDQIKKTMPYYEAFHQETINLVKAVNPDPKVWLDTGCGTGTLAEKAHPLFPQTKFILADPSGAMLDVAKKKLSGLDQDRLQILAPAATQDIILDIQKTPDIITAIQSHHYLSKKERQKAIEACFRLLKEDGLFITFENIRPFSDMGIEIGKEMWKEFQLSQGRDPEVVEKHIERFDNEYFPITIEEHLGLLKKAGFRVTELLWYSRMQAGFYGIK